MKVIVGLLVVAVLLLGGILYKQEDWHKQKAHQLQLEEDARVFTRQCEALDRDVSKHILAIAKCKDADLNMYYRFKDAVDEVKQAVNGDLLNYLKDPYKGAHIYGEFNDAKDVLDIIVKSYSDDIAQSQ